MFGLAWFINASTLLISFDYDFFGVQNKLFGDPNYWAVTTLGIVGVMMRDLAWKAYHRWWHPKLHHILVEMEKGHLEDIDLPESRRKAYSLDDVIQVCTLT
ncbi:unnamed protein product [Choristocarpus tenellus]